MAHGQDYSKRQVGIINRYYDNRDTIMFQKLSELVSELFLCEDDKKADKMWQSAKTALENTPANRVRVEKLLAERNVKELAAVVAELAVPGKAPTAPAQSAARTASALHSTASSPAPSPASNAGGTVGAPAFPPRPAAAPAGPPSADDIKAALKAFKKRLKLTRLDEESKLGHSPMSTGKGSGIVAITPPNQYPRAVWEELVKLGKLRNAGGGCYELLEP